jgi:aryl-alcohol dehydrogenase-like predicted oxidoreductase
MASPLPLSLKKSVDSTKVEYTSLGSSGLKVSVPILGAMSMGSSKWENYVLDEEQALPILKAAYDIGLNTWDTANAYSNGLSEQVIAKAITKYNIPREKVVIMTKCWGYVGEDVEINGFWYGQVMAGTKDYVNRGGKPCLALYSPFRLPNIHS